MSEDLISRKEFDNALLFLALSHIDNVYRATYLGSMFALSGGIISSSKEIVNFLKSEIDNAKKLAYLTVSIGYKEDDEIVKKQRAFIDEHISKCHSSKIKVLEKITNGSLPLEALLNAGIEDVILDYMFNK